METELPGKEFEQGHIEIQGHRAHYLRAGAGRPLLLLHGIVGSCANWKLNVPELAKHATVYALDLFGMGHSERVPALDPGLGETAQRVLAAMDALELMQADVAGASHGGAVAMMAAALAPHRVRSLILFAPANPYSTKADWIIRAYSNRLGSVGARLAPLLPRVIHQVALMRMFGKSTRIPDGCLDAYREALKVPGTIPHVLAIVRGWFRDMDNLRSRLASINKPTLLIWGDRDRVVSLESAERLQQELDAELVIISGGGHLIFQEFPEEVNRLMVEWLGRISCEG